ncbi:NAD-dependent epimerase/dehydratase family protein, partial [Candidatus Parcubacteria bacterium]|nr:NAD-dependent epimerase/dehydratase family protein [Candidatus Parcubacteria bacterium]
GREERGIEAQSLSRSEGTDIRDLNAFVEKLKAVQPDAIINCAAHVGSVHYVTEFAADVVRDNVLLAVNTYEGVRLATPKTLIINPLSNCSYPGDANTHFEPDWQKGAVHDSVLAYGSVKRLQYVIAESYKKQYGIRTVNWLIANAYGPGDYTDPNKVHALNGILIRLIKAQKEGAKTFEIWGTGKPLREWVYIKDVARVFVDSLSMDARTHPVNLAQNKAYSITEIAQIGAEALPYDVEFTYNTSKPDGAPIKVLEDTQFRAKHPDFQFTKLNEGIASTIEYYRKVL